MAQTTSVVVWAWYEREGGVNVIVWTPSSTQSHESLEISGSHNHMTQKSCWVNSVLMMAWCKVAVAVPEAMATTWAIPWQYLITSRFGPCLWAKYHQLDQLNKFNLKHVMICRLSRNLAMFWMWLNWTCVVFNFSMRPTFYVTSWLQWWNGRAHTWHSSWVTDRHHHLNAANLITKESRMNDGYIRQWQVYQLRLGLLWYRNSHVCSKVDSTKKNCILVNEMIEKIIWAQKWQWRDNGTACKSKSRKS